MSSVPSTMTDLPATQAPADPTNAPRSTANSKPRTTRVLACVLCQQRKIKCDRNFPCANCKRSGAQCVPTVTPQPRRRRFAERELLDRLRQYEELLRRNHVDFKPMHPANTAGVQGADSPGQHDADSMASAREFDVDSITKSEPAVDFLHAIKRMTMEPEDEVLDNPDDDGDDENQFHNENSPVNVSTSSSLPDHAWQYPSHVDKDNCNGAFLFGTPRANIDIPSLHPDQAQILRLWQTYLENVDPLLKCTHIPTLQTRIVDALGHMADIPPLLSALMFSIYCVSVMSLANDECIVRFGSPRKDLLAEYQSACQQALLMCKAWRSSEIDALTALYFYLMSLRPHTDPRSLSAILALVIRNARCMGLDNELANAKFTVLEAEMRRRLWWSLVTFDHRICELVEYKSSTLTPLWDCRLPLNVNDFELRSQMSTLPMGHERPTEAIFPFVWSQLADSLRHSSFHLTFINPALNVLHRPNTGNSEGREVDVYGEMIEKHLSACMQDDPLSFFTTWMVRGQLARHHLLEYYAKHSKESVQQTDSQREAALSHALGMLECDTNLRKFPLTRQYLWFVNFHVPAIAYFHIINHTKKEPNEEKMEEAWRVMRDNWNARAANRASLRKRNEQMTFDGFVQSVRKGWEAFGAALRRDMEDEVLEKDDLFVAGLSENPSMTAPVDIGEQSMPENSYLNMSSGLYSDIAGQSAMGGEMAHFWTAMDWRFMDTQRW